MKIYVITRIIEEFDLEENQILDLLKEYYPKDDEIKSAEKLDDIADVESVIMEEMDEILIKSDLKGKIKDRDIDVTLNYDRAYEIKEWGIH